MIITRSEMMQEDRTAVRGGEGVARFIHLVPEKTQKHMRLLAEVTLPPGASIGYHPHDNETEYFIFTDGTGMVNDNGVENPVQKGDILITGEGAAHSVTNTGQVPLVFHAFIVTY